MLNRAGESIYKLLLGSAQLQVLDLSHNRLEEGAGAITSALSQYSSSNQQEQHQQQQQGEEEGEVLHPCLHLEELSLVRCSIPDEALAALLLALEAVVKKRGHAAAVAAVQQNQQEGGDGGDRGRGMRVWLEGNVWGRNSAGVLLGLQEGGLKGVVQDVVAYEVDGVAQVAVQH